MLYSAISHKVSAKIKNRAAAKFKKSLDKQERMC